MQAITLSELQEEPDRVRVLIKGVDGTTTKIHQLELDDSRIERTRFTASHLEGLHLRTCELIDVELSGAHLENGSLSQVRISDSKLIGTDFSHSQLTDVTFDSCVLSSASFRFARLLRVKFENCVLDDASFQEAKIRETTLERCHIESTEFNNAEITSLDLRTSQIVSVRGVAGLTNSTMDEMQASILGVQLAREMGINITALNNAESVDIEDDEPTSEPTQARQQLAAIRKNLQPG